MQVAIIRFRFLSPLHIHGERADYETSERTLHNDTLYAAVVAALAELGKTFEEPLEMAFSSLMPFWTEGASNTHYFFPRPLLGHTTVQRDDENAGNVEDRKRIKKVQWLSLPLLRDFLTGNAGFRKQSYLSDKETKGAFAFVPQDIEAAKNLKADFLYTAEQVPRTRISREGKDTVIYYSERLRFAPNAGLYAVAVVPDNEKESLELALAHLAEAGLGTDRSVGNGSFRYEWDVLELPDVDSVSGYYNTGMLLPESAEQFLPSFQAAESGWQLERRGGWLTQEPNLGIQKKHVHMLSPGAYLAKGNLQPENLVAGKVADLKPDTLNHPVWRCGRTILLPVASPKN